MSSELRYKSSLNDLTTRLIRNYYGLVLARSISDVRKMIKDTNEEHFNDAKLMEKEGIIPKSERLHAEVAFAQAKKDYNSSLNDIAIIEESLKNLIKDEEADLREISVIPSSQLFMYNGELPKYDELRNEAIKNNPELKQSEVEKKIAKANCLATAAEYSPTVTVFAYDIAAQSNLATQLPRYGIGTGVNFLLFDGFSRYNNLKAANAISEKVKFNEITAKNNMEILISKNYNELLKFKEEYESTGKSLEKAEEALRCAKLAFKEGYGTSLNVTDAESSLSSIKIQRLNALYDFDVKLAEILCNIGKSSEFFEYLKNSTEENL